MTFQPYEKDVPVAIHNTPAVRSCRLALTFTTQSGYKVTNEQERPVSEEISNLDTCGRSLIFSL